MAKRDCVIFTGPSFSWPEVASIDQRLRCCPPAVRGDILKAAEMGVSIIGLIDGVFFNRAAVSHREIIDSMNSGTIIVGGSSMGALRAAELESYGMIGVGQIYTCFKEGVIEADDEVAVAYNPVTYEPVSEPLVNIRVALNSLADAAIINEDIGNSLLNLAKGFFYVERSFPAILKKAERDGIIGRRVREEIETVLNNIDYDLKKRDARLVVHQVVKLYDQRLSEPS